MTEPTIDKLEEILIEMNEDDERERMLKRVDESHKKDYDGSRRKYADKVSTSEALRNRVRTYHAQHNGHAGT